MEDLNKNTEIQDINPVPSAEESSIAGEQKEPPASDTGSALGYLMPLLLCVFLFMGFSQDSKLKKNTKPVVQEIETDEKFRSCIHKLSKGFRIFLSYTRVDTPFASRLRDELRVGGFEVYNPESMSLGTNWIQALEDAIREVTDTGIFVTLISKTSLRNDFWLKELTFAQENHGLVLPVIIEPIDKTAIPSHLQRIQWLDVSNEDNPYKMIEQILSAITRIRHEDFVRTCGRIIT